MKEVTMKEYLEKVGNKIEKQTRQRKSKVGEAILEVVKELIAKEEPTTVKVIAEALGKTIQQIHQTVKKVEYLEKVKIKSRTLIVPTVEKEVVIEEVNIGEATGVPIEEVEEIPEDKIEEVTE